MEKRSALQKAVLISAAAMAVAFAILTFVFHRLEGVKFEEGFLRVSAQADDPAATVYAGKVQGERVKITVTDCPDEQRTEVVVQVGDRVRDECAVETGLPPIQADQLRPVEHIRITRNGQLLFEGGYTAEHDMGWYDLEGNWAPFSGLEATFRTSGESYWDSYKTSAGTILRERAGADGPGQLDAVFHHAAVFRPAGAGRRIPIGPVPLAAYVRREGPGAVGLLSGNAAGGLVHLSDPAAHRVQHRPVGAAVAD